MTNSEISNFCVAGVCFFCCCFFFFVCLFVCLFLFCLAFSCLGILLAANGASYH